MSRVRPVLVAALLVAASATAAVAVGDVDAPAEPDDRPVVGTAENSTRVLLLTEADAAGFQQPNVSVMTTLDAGHEQLSAERELRRVEQRLDAAETDDQRRAVLENATERLNDRLTTLQARERNARQRYANGDMSPQAFLLEIASLHSQSEKLIEAIGITANEGSLYAYASDVSQGSDIRTRLSRVRNQLIALQGPVRDQVAGVVHGQRESVRVHVTVGNGLMLSTVDDDEYVRETYRPDNFVDEYADYGDVTSVGRSMYPWTVNNSQGGQYTLGGQLTIEYTTNTPYGQLATWINTGTREVYLEHQRLSLSQLPADTEARVSLNDTTLSASRTYTGGPLLVSVENETGAPIDAPVYVNGTQMGTTGPDGELWTISPAGEYSVSTVRNGTEVELNVTARPAP